MTMKDLASEIAWIEGKKSKARIGDIREILAILSDLVHEEYKSSGMSDILISIHTNGIKRSRRSNK